MTPLRLFLCALMLLLFAGVVNAQPRLPPKGAPLTCPGVTTLRKDKSLHWWAVKSIRDPASPMDNVILRVKWYSTESSLAPGVQRFIGAQYSGSTEGHVACLYMPTVKDNTASFPIAVYLEQMIDRPRGRLWTAAKGNKGLLNCVSSDPAECSYFVYRPAQIDDPYHYLMRLHRNRQTGL